MRSSSAAPLLFAFTLALACVGVVAFSPVQAGDRLLPEIPAAKGDRCVEPTEVMRRRHMQFLLDQRDLTVHDGIRTEKHRLVNCIGCHVQPRPDGGYPRHTDADHFCESCHRFSSVKMDCFQCHADRPAEAYTSRTIDKIVKQLP